MSETYNKDFYRVFLPWPQQATSHEIREFLQRGRSTLWEPFSISSEEKCKYLVDSENMEFANIEYSEAARDLAQTREGFIELTSENSIFSLNIESAFDDYGYEDFGGVSLTWSWSEIRDQNPATIDDIINIVTFAYEKLPVSFAFSQTPAAWEREIEVTYEDVEQERLPDVFWLMILSRAQSEEIGRSKLAAGPFWQSKVVADRSTRIIATPHPFDYSRSEKQDLRRHLGLSGDAL